MENNFDKTNELTYEEFVNMLADAEVNNWGPVDVAGYLAANPNFGVEHPNLWDDVAKAKEQLKNNSMSNNTHSR